MKFDRACIFVRTFRDKCRQTGFDFTRKYQVLENDWQDPCIDYDEMAMYPEAFLETDVAYPDGGRAGDMVWFRCAIHADSYIDSTKKTMGFNDDRTKLWVQLNDRWMFDGITLRFEICMISMDGRHPFARSPEWIIYDRSEPNNCIWTMEKGFTELTNKYLFRKGYTLTPLSDAEVALYPNIDDDYCVSNVMPV